MTYVNEGIDARAEVLFAPVTSSVAPNIVDTLVFYARDADGALVTVDALSAFLTVYSPNGGVVVARTAATIAANGKLSFAQKWVEPTFWLAEDYYAIWEWKVGGVDFADRQYFDVVLQKLPCLIDGNDLLEHIPNLEKHLVAIGETDSSKFTRNAWSLLLDRIRAAGNRPSLILDRSRLVNPAKMLALSLACGALVRVTDDVWDKRQQRYDKTWESLHAGLGELKYDLNEDGLREDGEETRVNRVKGWV